MRLIKVYCVRANDFDEKWINEDEIKVVTKTSVTLPRTNQVIPFSLYLKTDNPFECYLDLTKPIESVSFTDLVKNECKGTKK